MIGFVRFFVNIILFALPPTHFFKLRGYLYRLSGLNVEGGVCFCGHGFVYGRGRVSIKSGTWISPGLILRTHVDAPITIGSNCDIGPSVELVTGSHLIGSQHRRAGEGTAFPIEIGDGCWIGARSVILGGVRVGAGSVIAAGSVVISNVPDNTLVAGVPARIKRQLDGGPIE